MSVTMQNLDALCLSALYEVGNIGAGNAMTALATMLEQRVVMSVPQVGVVSLAQFTHMAGGQETLSVGVYMPVGGDAPGHVAFLWTEESALRLADQLLDRSLGSTQMLGNLERSALTEVGNILTSSFLMAISEMTGLNLLPSPPVIAIDMTAAILSAIAAVFEAREDQALTILTRLGEAVGAVEGFFIYVPELYSLPVMLRALGLGD